MNIKRKTFHSTAILVSGYMVSQIIRFGGSLITTRLLAPELFGIMAVVTSIATLVALFSDVGLNLSVIRSKRGDDLTFLRTVFSFKVLQTSALATVIVTLALIFYWLNSHNLLAEGSVYATSELSIALSIVAIAVFMQGFRSIQIELAARNQNVGRQTAIEISAQSCSLLFIVLLSRENPSIYALAFAQVVSAFVTVAGSYLLFPRKTFGFAWDKSAVKEIISFGKWILGSTAIVGISNNLDKLLFGFLLTSTQMGVYSIAALIFNAMDTVFKRINAALFPAISRVIREGKSDLSKVYYKIRLYRDLAVCIPSGLVLINGDILISLLYDDRYLDAGFYLQLLTIAQLIECFFYKNQLLISLGETRLQFDLAIRRLVALIIFVPAGYYFFGVTGILLALSARRLIGGWLIFIRYREHCEIKIQYELRTVAIILTSIAFWFIARMALLHVFPALDPQMPSL
ncbi:oligosaccharide flippase family protein [Teredinibacter turnerae]|uniref:oligosaccharide flippase family protein n=1 Tax=Teredinibacter turnerae TaxID=2426 RepID=UPI00039F2EB9|nr:oligosaccharide flippase family protein [Teredinibacter turnerae]